MATPTGLEPATSAVTGLHSTLLNHGAIEKILGGDSRLPARFNIQDTLTTLLSEVSHLTFTFAPQALLEPNIYKWWATGDLNPDLT